MSAFLIKELLREGIILILNSLSNQDTLLFLKADLNRPLIINFKPDRLKAFSRPG